MAQAEDYKNVQQYNTTKYTPRYVIKTSIIT